MLTRATGIIDHYLCLRNDHPNVSNSSVCLPAGRLVGTERRALRSRAKESAASAWQGVSGVIRLSADCAEFVAAQALNLFDPCLRHLLLVLGFNAGRAQARDVCVMQRRKARPGTAV